MPTEIACLAHAVEPLPTNRVPTGFAPKCPRAHEESSSIQQLAIRATARNGQDMPTDRKLKSYNVIFRLTVVKSGTRGGGVEDFEADEVAVRVVVEDHARLVLVAFGNGPRRQHNRERIGG